MISYLSILCSMLGLISLSNLLMINWNIEIIDFYFTDY